MQLGDRYIPIACPTGSTFARGSGSGGTNTASWLLWRVRNKSCSGMYQTENIWRTRLGCKDHSAPIIWCLLDRLSARKFSRPEMWRTNSVIPCCWHQSGEGPMWRGTRATSECLPDSEGRQPLSCYPSGTSLLCLWSEGRIGGLLSEWLEYSTRWCAKLFRQATNDPLLTGYHNGPPGHGHLGSGAWRGHPWRILDGLVHHSVRIQEGMIQGNPVC